MYYKYKVLDIIMFKPQVYVWGDEALTEWVIIARSMRRMLPGNKRLGYYHFEVNVQDPKYAACYPKRQNWENWILKRTGRLSTEEALVHWNKSIREVIKERVNEQQRTF